MLTFLKPKPLTLIRPKPVLNNKVFWDLDKNGMSQSMLMDFLACREKARLAHKEGWNTEGVSHPMIFGSLFHACLERVYKHMAVGGDPRAMIFKNIISVVIDEFKKETMAEQDWTLAHAEEVALDEGYLNVLIPEYVKTYAKKDMKQEWLLVEDEFMNEHENVIFRGKFDAVYRNTHNEIWIKETKTKYLFEPHIQTRLSYDLQVHVYILNYFIQYKEMPTGFVYDMIQRPRIRRKMNETLKEFIARLARDVDGTYFKRIRMRVEPDQFKHWHQKEFRPMVNEFREWARGTLPNYRNPASCETKYGACKFLRVCGENDYSGLYQRRRVFPELEGSVLFPELEGAVPIVA